MLFHMYMTLETARCWQLPFKFQQRKMQLKYIESIYHFSDELYLIRPVGFPTSKQPPQVNSVNTRFISPPQNLPLCVCYLSLFIVSTPNFFDLHAVVHKNKV